LLRAAGKGRHGHSVRALSSAARIARQEWKSGANGPPHRSPETRKTGKIDPKIAKNSRIRRNRPYLLAFRDIHENRIMDNALTALSAVK
jgi:hypothetical protein